MNPHERQYFDFLLLTAADRFVERITQRCEGEPNALAALRTDPYGEGVWIDHFTDAIFSDFLLDNTAGACFVLAALEKRAFPDIDRSGKVADVMGAAARRAFAELLTTKTIEALEQAMSYGGRP